MAGLRGSHSVVTAWNDSRLIGLGNAISDGAPVVYFPHMVVAPPWQGRGVGREIFERLRSRYDGFRQQVVLSDRDAVGFYERCGLERAGSTIALWTYDGDEHS